MLNTAMMCMMNSWYCTFHWRI